MWQDASSLFGELFDDLNRKNLLRKTTIPIDRDKLKRIWKNTMFFSGAFNEISRKFKEFESKEQLEDFASNMRINSETLNCLFLSQTLSTLLIYYESLLRTSLLFFLEEEQGITKDMTLGSLLNKIAEITPSIGKRLREIVDKELRNVIAHGNFWFEQDGLHYAKNSYLEENIVIKHRQLRKKIGRVGIVAIALIRTLGDRIEKGYFKI